MAILRRVLSLFGAHPLDEAVFEIMSSTAPWTNVYRGDASLFQAERPKDDPGVRGATFFRSFQRDGIDFIEVGYRKDLADVNQIKAWLEKYGLTLRLVQ